MNKQDVPLSFVFEYPPVEGYAKMEKALKKKIPNLPAPSPVLVGIEFEVENIINGGDFRALGIVRKEDGSLRNHGVEYITCPFPHNWSYYVTQTLQETLAQMGNEPVFSNRTSTHVHVNVQDFTVTELGMFLLIYLSVEKLLYRFVGKERKQNIYCVPLCDTNIPETLGKILLPARNGVSHMKYLEVLQEYIARWSKYLGLNIGPITQSQDRRVALGTVEFRHLYGTMDAGKVSTWIDIIGGIRNTAKSGISFEALLSRIENLNTSSDYSNFVTDLLGPSGAMLLQEGFEDLLYLGTSSVKDVFFFREQEEMDMGSFSMSDSLFSKLHSLSSKKENKKSNSQINGEPPGQDINILMQAMQQVAAQRRF